MAIQRDKVIANAEKLVAKGKIEPAIKEYERLLDDNPNDVNTLNRIGDLWVRINRNDEAVKTFGKIADHYARDGFFLKAIAIYKKINKLDPSKLEVYGKLADLYAKQGLAMEAKSQYQVLADYYLKHGDPGNALLIYRKISELDPQSINVHVKLADLHSQIGQTGEALKEYDRVGRMLLKRGMLDEAVQVFKKALKIDAKNVDLVESLVTALIESKDYGNAITIVEHALEQNRENPRLLAMWGKILIGKGDLPSARTALERGLKAEPNEPSIRDALADLYLKQNDANRALEMLVPLVERALGRGERGQAVEMLNRVLRVDQRHTPTLERIVALYTRLNEETNILSSMNLLAEAHVARGQFQQASDVLQRLIDREPQNAQHRTKLQFVRSQMGGETSAPPIRKKTAPGVAMPSMEVEEPAPTFQAREQAPPLSMEIDSTPSMDLDFSSDLSSEPETISLDAEMPSLEGESNDDLDFITEHLTEAEVFAKYGLAEKAAEHLRAVIDRAPKHIPAYDRLFRILLDEGDTEGGRNVAKHLVALLEEKGDEEAIKEVNNEFILHGLTFKPAPAKPAAVPPAKAAPPPPPPPEPELEVETEVELEPELGKEQEISFDLDVEPVETELDLEPEVELEPVAELEVEHEISFEESTETEIPLAAEDAQPLFSAEVEAVVEEPVAEEPTTEELGEIDFYLESELFDEAREKADFLLARFPENLELKSRIERIEDAAAAAAEPPPPPPPPPPIAKPVAKAAAPAAKPAAPPPPPPPKPAAAAPRASPPAPQPPPKPVRPPSLSTPKPPALSREEIDSELLSAIPDDEYGETIAPAPPRAAEVEPAPVFAAAQAQEENLFADEDDFFDLAAELESELEEDEDVVSLSDEEQSLEEIFKEFKKGVEQQLDSEDYDTHYNLGIAYKEMGLIDEAIGEFQLASKDPKRAVECSSMLGLCFLEKGMPQLAIKWYRKGLEMPEISEDEHVGLLYDLGSAYVEVGDTDNAQKAFMEVYASNSNYRDIVSRMKQLEDAKR